MTHSQMDMIRSTNTDEQLDYCSSHEQRWIFRVETDRKCFSSVL